MELFPTLKMKPPVLFVFPFISLPVIVNVNNPPEVFTGKRGVISALTG